MAPEVLLSELPPDPSKSWPLAALATYQQQVQAIKDLCQRHRGEVREISGEWTQIDRPFPEPATGGIHFFHAQFCLSAEGQRALTLLQLAGARGGSWQAALANTFLQPAPGGVSLRCRSCSLSWGAEFTAKAIYEYYLAARIIVHKRVHGCGSLVRQRAAHERTRVTGYYGFGRR